MRCISIVKKALMAITGLGLLLFLILHLSGNLFLFAGSVKFNQYATFMERNPLLIPAEIGLIAIFLVHVWLAIRVSLENTAARPSPKTATAGQSMLASRTMMITGVIVFVFIVLHVYLFKFGPKHAANGDMKLWELVVKEFQNPLIVGWYVIAMLTLGLHLSHGIASAFQSLGLRNSGGHPRLRGVGPALAWIIALGFASMPLWAIFLKPVPKEKPPLHIKEGAITTPAEATVR